nr:transposase [Streptomyces aureus]
MGRSRGGFTSKLHLSADGRCRPPRKKPDSLAADRAYSNGPIREYLRRRGIRHTIPEKTDSQAARLRKGSRGGRLPGFDEDRYKKRNTIERAINRLKQAGAVATRYDKRGYVSLGTATAASRHIAQDARTLPLEAGFLMRWSCCRKAEPLGRCRDRARRGCTPGVL